MEQDTELVTVFRSPDHDAEAEAARIARLLSENGLDPVVCDDSTAGVVTGTCEVRLPAGQASRADAILAAHPKADQFDPADLDVSHDLDLVTVFKASSSASAEIEVMSIRAILEANDVDVVVVDNPMMPSLPIELRVAHADEERALIAMAEAQAAGPAAAEEAEQQSEEAGQNAG